MGVIERIGSMAGTEMAKAVNLAHETFQDRVGEHGHTGRALVETVTEVCRNHPNAVGIAVGLMVEQYLVHEKHLHDALEHEAHEHAAAEAGHPSKPARSGSRQVALNKLHISKIRPGKIAFEVFGALVALKFASAVAHVMGRKSHKEAWFSPAARIHSISASIAAYNLASAIKSKDISSWRNAAVVFFGTHAIKPVLKVDRAHRAAAAARAAAPKPATPPVQSMPAAPPEPAAAPPPAPAPAAVSSPAPVPVPLGIPAAAAAHVRPDPPPAAEHAEEHPLPPAVEPAPPSSVH